jgi:hypothetical protein
MGKIKWADNRGMIVGAIVSLVVLNLFAWGLFFWAHTKDFGLWFLISLTYSLLVLYVVAWADICAVLKKLRDAWRCRHKPYEIRHYKTPDMDQYWVPYYGTMCLAPEDLTIERAEKLLGHEIKIDGQPAIVKGVMSVQLARSIIYQSSESWTSPQGLTFTRPAEADTEERFWENIAPDRLVLVLTDIYKRPDGRI